MLTRAKARLTGQVPIFFITDRKERKKIISEARKTASVGKDMEAVRLLTRSLTERGIDLVATRVAAVLYPLYAECAQAASVTESVRVCIAIMDFLLRSPSDIPFLVRFCAPFASTLRAKCREFREEPLASFLLRSLCDRVLHGLL